MKEYEMNTIDHDIGNPKRSLGIRTKLFLGFATLSIILFISIIMTLVSITDTKDFSSQVITTELPINGGLIDLNSSIATSQNNLLTWLITNDNHYKTEIPALWKTIDTIETELDTLITKNSEFFADFQSVKTQMEQLKNFQLRVLSAPDKVTANRLLLNDVIPLFAQLTNTLNMIDVTSKETHGLLDKQNARLVTHANIILTDIEHLKLFEYGVLIVGFLLAIIITIVTTNKILPPLKKAIHIAQKIASGDRHIKVTVNSTDETGQLLASLKTMQKEIKESENRLIENETKTRNLYNSIVNAAKLFSEHSSRVAAGDLRNHLELNENDEKIMVQLGNDLNQMTENLAAITKEITHVCQNMVTTVDEVHQAIDAQSSGASEQASSVNEITASLSEIEKSSAQTMLKAKTLGESAERTREKGQLGLSAVDQSVTGMQSVRDKVQLIAQTILDLSKQTQQVGEITALVNNLAQQSKMLALNASIEAAKAGEAGKGFAVVAVEVKNLAEQSEQATSQVQKILEDIQHAAEKAVMVTEEGTKGVDEGMQLVEQTGDVIRNLNDVIHETTIASEQIESAVRQESAGIEQITSGMNEINQVTMSFVSSVKQTTEAINHLSGIAKSLKSSIDTYKI
jgi:methyl-accepting chemotaxis protein